MRKRIGVIGVLVIGCTLGAQARAAGTELSRFWLPPQAGPKTVGDIEGQPESVPEFTVTDRKLDLARGGAAARGGGGKS